MYIYLIGLGTDILITGDEFLDLFKFWLVVVNSAWSMSI